LPKRLGRAVKVLHQIAGALAAMHRLNPPIVHRDLKPANILMAGATPRITDFGIGSVALPEGSEAAFTARLPTDMHGLCTALYASPEQRFGAPASPRDDVFALGVIAWQFVSGDAYGQPGTDALAELRDLKVPTELASLIVRSTAFNPERRPKDGGEWEATLAALIARFRSQPEASTASVPVLIAESGSVPGLVPTSVPPAQTNTSSPSKPYVVPPPLPTRAGSEPEIETERAEELPEEAIKRRRGLLAVLVVACVALVVGLFVALRDPKPNEVAKNQPEVPAPKSKGDSPDPKPKVATFPANPKAGDEYTLRVGNPAVEMAFCWIPPGNFQMGGTGYDDEKPAHKVTISKGFRMGQTEVTQAQWKAVMGSESPSHFKGPERPVDSVTWDEAQQFCQKLQESMRKGGMSGVTVRLPTEAEWEYACRAGTTSDYWSGSDEAALRRAGWFDGNSQRQTQPVGKLAKNAWGLYDVHGNVWEWCHDDKRTYTAQEQVDPVGNSNDDSRVLRGGSWGSSPDLCRAAFRFRRAPASRSLDYGFRVCFRLD